jgi:hypothetical protein
MNLSHIRHGFLFNSNTNILSNVFIKNLFSSYVMRRKIGFVKNWINIKYFFSLDILTCFFNLQKNRLRNIFLFFFKDPFFFKEIEKLFDINLLGFSSEFVYEKDSILKTNFLSIVLLEMYFIDFDDFLFYLSIDFNSFKNLGSSFSYSDITNCHIPLKFELVVSDLLNLSNLFSFNFNSITFTRFEFSSYFVKYFVNCRYKCHSLFGFVSSKKFLLIIKSKLIFFLRSVLFFDVKEFSISSKKIWFLGFNISCFFTQIRKMHNSSIIAVLKKKLCSRLNLIKKKFLDLFLFRIRFELITNFLLKKNLVNLFFFKSLDYKFWSYFFQNEASRCFRYYCIIFSDDFRHRCSI